MSDSDIPFVNIELERALYADALRRRGEPAESTLTDEELFARNYRAYLVRVEDRARDAQETILARHGIEPGDWEILRELVDPDRRAVILAAIARVDLVAMRDEIRTARSKPRLERCKCGVIGYWPPVTDFSARPLKTPLCDDCAERERVKREAQAARSPDAMISSAIATARGLQLLATLTPEQWRCTLDHFDDACAYCGADWTIVEHVTPSGRGGGTTIANCLPACVSCNTRKRSKTIEELRDFDAERIGFALRWLRLWGRT